MSSARPKAHREERARPESNEKTQRFGPRPICRRGERRSTVGVRRARGRVGCISRRDSIRERRSRSWQFAAPGGRDDGAPIGKGRDAAAHGYLGRKVRFGRRSCGNVTREWQPRSASMSGRGLPRGARSRLPRVSESPCRDTPPRSAGRRARLRRLRPADEQRRSRARAPGSGRAPECVDSGWSLRTKNQMAPRRNQRSRGNATTRPAGRSRHKGGGRTGRECRAPGSRHQRVRASHEYSPSTQPKRHSPTLPKSPAATDEPVEIWRGVPPSVYLPCEVPQPTRAVRRRRVERCCSACDSASASQQGWTPKTMIIVTATPEHMSAARPPRANTSLAGRRARRDRPEELGEDEHQRAGERQ